MAHEIKIQVGELLFEFDSKQDWVNTAKNKFREARASNDRALAIDAKGRIVMSGREFARAEDDNAYPVSVYRKII